MCVSKLSISCVVHCALTQVTRSGWCIMPQKKRVSLFIPLISERMLCILCVQVLVRMSLGMDQGGNVAMKLVVRADSEAASEAVHSIIQNA